MLNYSLGNIHNTIRRIHCEHIMDIFLRLLLSFFVVVPSAFANNPRGLSNIGLAVFNLTAPKFNCNGFFSAISDLETLHVSFLYNTFGNDFSCLTRLLHDPRLETLQIHLINEPGHRNKRLGNYEFLYNLGNVAQYDRLVKTKSPRVREKLISYVEPIVSVLNSHLQPHTSLLISPGLESNLSDRSGKVLVSWTRQLFPNARIVWNPLVPVEGRREKARGDLIEGHGQNPDIDAPCLFNLDGTDVSYPERLAIGEKEHKESSTKNWVQSGRPLFQLLETFANRCEIAYVWAAESNGIDATSPTFIDPRKRNHNIPTSMYRTIVQDVIALNKKGRIYPPTFEYTELDDAIVSSCSVVRTDFSDKQKAGRLLKQSEFRNRGGVIILGKEYSSVLKIQIFKGNRRIDTYRRDDFYKDGRPLFRSKISPTRYPFKTYIVFINKGKKICFKVPNPRIRID